MKNLIILILISITNNCFCQDKLLGVLPLEKGKVVYSGVVNVDSVGREELYKRVRRWFTNAYKSSNNVIQLDDKESGELIGKGSAPVVWQFSFMSSYEINIHHTIKIQVKDERYRYEIYGLNVNFVGTNMNYVDEPIETWYQERIDNCKKNYPAVDSRFKSLITSLETFVKAPSNDNW